MYKVMLVDDEKLILQGLQNIIEWNELGLEVVQTASNGEDALEKFKENPVDIIITDINMPKLTGLQLLKALKGVNNNVKFIILSGYDEFSYAKTAIELGVENYILKPINEEELEKSLIKIKNSLDAEKKKRNSSLLKQNGLIKIINGQAKKEDLDEIKDFINININEKAYSTSIITIKCNLDNEIYHRINSIINKNMNNKCEILYNLEGHIIVINSWKVDVNNSIVKEVYNKLKDQLINEINLDVFISIGEIVEDICNINVSYLSAKNLRKYILTEGFNRCLLIEDVSNIKEENRRFYNELDELNKIIIEKNQDKAEEYINEIFDNSELTPKNIYDLSIRILLLIDKISEEFKVDKSYSGDSLGDVIVELCSENTRDSIKSLLISETKELVALMNPTTIKYSPIVQQVISYVNENYYEDLSLKTLANKYNINTSYLGQVFTKEVGCSFSDYFNKIKNSKAKELILNTNMRINDIAKEVGYLDTSYFYRKFKKYYGVSPSTLRNIKNY